MSEIPVEPVGLSAVRPRRAVVADARDVGTSRVVLQRVIDIVANVQIEPAVAVEIEKRRRHRYSGLLLNAARLRDVGEGAVAIVVEQLVRAEVGQQQIDAAVVVDVAGRDAEAVLTRIDAALVGHVREVERPRAVRTHLQVVAKQTSAKRQRSRRRRHQRVGQRFARPEHLALHDEHVEIAVVVEVEERDAGRQDLRVVALPARLQLVDGPPVVPVHRDLLDLVEVGRVDLPGRYPQQEEVLLLPVPPAVEGELHHVAEDRLSQRFRVDPQPGLLEQLARGRDHAGSLRGAEGLATVHGHAGILDVHASARKSVEAAGKLELVAAADPKHVSAFADQDYGGCRPDAGHSIDSLARTCMIP